MSFIGSLFSNDKGAGFQGSGTNVDSFNPEQAAGTYGSQNAFVTALLQSNGLGNLSSVYNRLGDVAAGKGPNPAQDMLNTATGNNVATTAAQIAGARGANANPGLAARNAAIAGAGIQQQAAGQGATLAANQEMNALEGQGQIANEQVNQAQAGLGQSLGAIAAANNARVGMQSNINNVNAGIAQGNQAEQAGTFNGFVTSGGQVLNALADGGEVMDPALATGATMDWSNYGTAPNPGLATGVTTFKSRQEPTSSDMAGGDEAGPSSIMGRFLQNMYPLPGVTGSPQNPYIGQIQSSAQTGSQSSSGGGGKKGGGLLSLFLNEGGKVPAMVSPGEEYLSPKQAKKVAAGKMSPMAGKKIPGKAAINGDSLKNDTVHAHLKEGGVVIPRSVMQSKDPAEGARKFVAAVMARQGMRRAS